MWEPEVSRKGTLDVALAFFLIETAASRVKVVHRDTDELSVYHR